MKFADIKIKGRAELEELLKEEQVKLGQLTFERIAQIKTHLWNTR
jgi:hypothetical protein